MHDSNRVVYLNEHEMQLSGKYQTVDDKKKEMLNEVI